MRRTTVRFLVALVVWMMTSAANRHVAADPLPSPTNARLDIPVGIPCDLSKLPRAALETNRLALQESSDGQPPERIAVQFEPVGTQSTQGVAWFIVDESKADGRRYRPVPVEAVPDPWKLTHDVEGQAVELWEGDARVLRFNHGPVPVRQGTHPHFVEGQSYERGDYIHPVYGLDGELLTEDYPRDHPHHRGVWWSWPVTRWKDELADIWAVSGVWSRPERITRLESGPVFALVEAVSTWKFGEQETPIATETVLIRTFRASAGNRVVDVEVRLKALTERVSIGGRPKAGYGGFALRAAPCEQRQITSFTDPTDRQPQRAWIDYAGRFPGGKGISGITIFEHATNPGYPNPLHEYPQCNCVMPAYPEQREVTLPQDKPIVLKHRLWLHRGPATERALARVWSAYANPPRIAIEIN